MSTDLDRGLKKTVDWVLIGCYILLVLTGCLNIYAATQSGDPGLIYDLGERSGKQLMWFGISACVAALVLFVINPRLWEVISTPSYLLLLVLLVAVIFLSRDVKGSHSWFSLGPISFQPAEVSKITTSLMLASVLSRQNFRMSSRKDFITMVAVVAVPMMIIVAESETGSALVYVGFLFALYREGLSGWFIFVMGMAIFLFILTMKTSPLVSCIVLAVIVAFLLLRSLHGTRLLREKRAAWRNAAIGLALGAAFAFSVQFVFDKILQPHQQARIEVLLGLKEDPAGAGYNVHQSMIAIGSGGFFGKGFLQGTQTAYGFVPEQATDFIFCTVGEEWGWLGCFFVIALFGILIFRIIQDADQSRESFTRIYGYCLASCLFMHLFINIGMTIGLMPVIGIPLPYISYGGSSLLSFTLMLFIFIALNRQENKYF